MPGIRRENARYLNGYAPGTTDYKEYMRLKEIEQDRKDYASALQVKVKNKKWTSHKDLKKAMEL